MVVVCSALVALGSWTLYTEFPPRLPTTGSELTALVLSTPPLSPSYVSRRDVLLECATFMAGVNSLMQRYLPEPHRATITPLCLDYAEEAIGEAPTDAFAWFVAASAHARLSQWAAFNDSLRQSQRMGRSEQWVAEFRVALAERHLSNLDAATARAHNQDLALLVRSTRGVHSIASRYIKQPEFRARIVSLVEAMPPYDQERFITALTLMLDQAAAP